MRKKFVLFFLIPLVICLVVVYFFVDDWVEAGLEYGGQDFVGAMVEIDNLKVSFSPLGLSFTRMQVANPADPWANFFETGPVEVTMNLDQLLRGKYIIEDVEIKDLILGTKRTTSGAVPGTRSRAVGASGGPPLQEMMRQLLDKTVEKTPLFDPALLRGRINVDSLVRAQNFATLALIDTIRQNSATAAKEWDSTLRAFKQSEENLKKLEGQIKTISPSELKTVEQITSAITTVDNAQKTLGEVKSTFTGRQEALRKSVGQFTSAVGSIDESIKRDYQKVLSLARLPNLDATGLAELILGKQLLAKAEEYAHLVELAQAQYERYAPKPSIEKPPRLKGQNIHFSTPRGYPKFWIRNLKISGGTDRTRDPEFIYLKGTARNITSDQRATGEALTFGLDGTRGTSMSLSLSGLMDRREETPLDEFKASVAGFSLSDVEIGKVDFLPSTIARAALATEVALKIPGNQFDANIGLQFRDMTMAFGTEPRNIGERLARQILEGVQGFNADVRLWKDAEGLDVAFKTNLDQQFASGIRTALGAELAKIQNDVRTKVEGIVATKRTEFEKVFAQKREEVLKQLEVYQGTVDQVTGLFDSKKKELLARLEQEKKGAVDKLVKDLFKK